MKATAMQSISPLDVDVRNRCQWARTMMLCVSEQQTRVLHAHRMLIDDLGSTGLLYSSTTMSMDIEKNCFLTVLREAASLYSERLRMPGLRDRRRRRLPVISESPCVPVEEESLSEIQMEGDGTEGGQDWDCADIIGRVRSAVGGWDVLSNEPIENIRVLREFAREHFFFINLSFWPTFFP